MANSVRFTQRDAYILWVIPAPGCSLDTLVRCYCFENQEAPPPFPEMSECLAKATQAGLLKVSPSREHFALTPDWYKRTHHLENEIDMADDARMEFVESLTNLNWPIANGQTFELARAEYEAAVPASCFAMAGWEASPQTEPIPAPAVPKPRGKTFVAGIGNSICEQLVVLLYALNVNDRVFTLMLYGAIICWFGFFLCLFANRRTWNEVRAYHFATWSYLAICMVLIVRVNWNQ